MKSYNHTFAEHYDALTLNVEYEKRFDYMLALYKKFAQKSGKVLDLACGTGTFSKLFYDNGFDVTGIDLSQEMLCVADNKLNGKVSFLCADMCNFSLNEKYSLCICCLDSINHLDNLLSVKKCFDCVYNALDEGGIFIFDVNTPFKHNEILADNTFVFDEEDFFLSWDNELLEENVVRIILDFFIFNGKSYDRYSEEFFERAYSTEELKGILDKFEILAVYDELTLDAPKADSERVYFVCKRK